MVSRIYAKINSSRIKSAMQYMYIYICAVIKNLLQVIMYASLSFCNKLRNNTFCHTKVKYFYNAESKYRSTKK